MHTQLHSESEPDASLPKTDEGPEVKSSDARLPDFKQYIVHLPSGTTLFLLYLQLCFPFFLLVTLAECDIVFLAMIIPFPILITTVLFSVCLIDMSHPANSGQHNRNCNTDNTEKNSNKQMQENKLSSNNEDELNEQIICDEDSEGICISILAFIKALLCIFIIYECQFNFIEHQPFGSLLCRGILATVLRVQCSFIIISMHVLPEKIVGSLVGIYEQKKSEDDFLKEKTCSDPLLNFLHVMRFRTVKHKKQRLVLNKNWKYVLNRISNFKKKYINHSGSVKNHKTKAKQSNKNDKIPVTVCSTTEVNVIQYLVFGLSVISLPGLILLYLVIPKIQTFTKFLYNLSDDWLENVVLFHSYLFSTHHYLYISSVIFGNMAINSFCTAILLETFPALSGSYILLVSIHPVVQDILQFCSFTSLTCVYFMLLCVGEYGLLLLSFFFGSLFQFTSDTFSLCNFWSFGTLLGVLSIFEYVLVDLFNIYLSLPGNLLCFVSPFKHYMLQVFVKDWYGKTHIFRLLQTATVSDLEKQILVKFKLSSSDYWLSGPGGNKMASEDKLVDLTTVQIRGRLLGGINKCCIKGCTRDAVSQRRLQCMKGAYELKIAPENLCEANDIPLFVCDHHYHFQKKRGHKQKRLYSSVLQAQKIHVPFKTMDKKEVGNCVSLLGVKTCTSCKKDIVVTMTTPCSQHILKISSKYYMCACNCLDQISNGKIQEINSDMYDCFSDTEDHSAKYDLDQNYICTECSPGYLKTIKIEKDNYQEGLGRNSNSENTQETRSQSSAETPHITFPFSVFFSGSTYDSNKSILHDYEYISNMFLLLSKTQFSPWEVYLQHGKTGAMLHFCLESGSESLPTKKLTLFCPFLFGTPYQVSFSVYVLGKQVDNGFLPDDYFKKISHLLDTLFSLQLCLGIYDEKLLKCIKMRQQINDSGNDCSKTCEVDSKFVLSNRYGKQISETIRSVNPQRPCKRFLVSPYAEKCSNCTVLIQTRRFCKS